MGAAGDHHIAESLGAGGEAGEGGHHLVAHDAQAALHLELLDVLGEIAAGEAQVDALVAGQFGELLDARLHVVQGGALAGGDGGEVDVALHPLVVADRLRRYRHAQVALRLHHRDPEIALQQDTAFARPDRAQCRGGVALGEHVGDHQRGGGSGLRRSTLLGNGY